ncbi:unnamed protein product [Ceutorhynchus assimilis]|uniref:Msx2-interacting protein n=1 Tax=Ceutorhynchus assimilis TaxID=467358 RepID=A0A9P0DKM4_9CUCU|nr:unnamed protein product [Ceutorhynchus assimilis]
MVRETRHLWVGNLPENIREDRIREHFKRYGRVQSVKLLPRVAEDKTSEVQMACTVAFMDIKSASKAHNSELKIDDRTLNTEYYEPAAIPSAASPHQGTPPPYSTSTSPGSTRFPNGHGSSEEHGFPDPSNIVVGGASTRFYDRTGGSVGAAPTSAAPEAGSGTCRGGRNRDRFRGGGCHRGGAAGVWGATAPVTTYTDTSRYNNSNERIQSDTTGYSSAPSSDTNDRRNSDSNVRKKTTSRSGSRSPSPNGSTSTRSPSRSGSRSSSSSSSSSTSRGTSSTSSPSRTRRHRKHYKKSSAQNATASDDRRPLGICVRNLPVRSSDTSLKDGLFHEYKKHGKVTWVKIVGQNADRHAIVCFKKPEDAEKALEVSYDKLFFGCKIEVAPYAVCDIDEVECRYESEIDEFNPKATRTLFIGNLEKDVTASDLRKHFDQFGEIIEIDIKKQGAVSSYAFCQYSDIISVVKAIRKMDGEHLGNNRIKLGFGKSMAYSCVWIDGVAETVNEKYLRMQFESFGTITKCIIDREKGQSLLFYEHVSQAQQAVNKMRGFVLKNVKLQVDFASRECQECFFERLEKQGTVLDRAGFEDRSSTRSFESSAPSRISRYDTPTRPRTSSYSSRSSAAAIASPGTPGSATPRAGRGRVRYYEYDLEYPATALVEGSVRHTTSHRSYDEYSQGSAASHEDPYDPYDHPVAYLHDSPGHLDSLEFLHPQVRVVQNLVDAVPYAPHDIRNLQKERVHLLEQLEDCPSSGDEIISPKKRLKLDLLDPTLGDVIIEANRDHNRKVMEVRKLSESTLRHHSRRPSVDNKYSHYAPHTVGCKRRRTGGSDGGVTKSTHSHYAEHSDGSEQATGSRPGTPLCDENPEFPPGEPPKRTTRERGEGPMLLPLPKWAAQVRVTPEFQRGTISVAGIKGQKEHVNPLASPPPAATSPRVSHMHLPRPPSPLQHVPPPASPPPRPPSLSSNSSDSDGATGTSPSLDERIKSLDEKYEKWSGSRALSAAGNDALALLDANREKFRLRHKLLEIQDLKEVQPSEIVKSVMAKRSVFDEDLKRLESVGEKYEPKEFGLFCRLPSTIATPTTPVSSVSTISATPLTVIAPTLKIIATSVTSQLPKTPTTLSPRSSGVTTLPIAASRGLQYPFPSHPPLQMSPVPPPSALTTATTTIITTTTTTSVISTPPSPSTLTISTSSSVTVRNPSHGENNRLKPSVNVPGDSSRTSSIKNRNSVAPSVVSDVPKASKPSEKVNLRRNSSSTSPRADVKTRRNSDTCARRIEDTEKTKSEEQKLADKAKEEFEKQTKEQEEKERIEKERLEKEKQEKERLERERKEKERLERESELEKQRLEKERLEKERIQREKEKAEKERIRQEKAKLEKERLEKENLERERLEKERLEKEKLERELKEKLEAERKEKEEREQKAKEEAKEKERKRSEDRTNTKNKEPSDNHHERSSKHRENHSESKHRENHSESKHSSTTKEEKPSIYQENTLNKYVNLKTQIERDAERRKESIKENRDNNIHDKHKLVAIETKDRAVVETRHMSLDLDNKNSILDPNRRKERNNSLPSNVGLKRRLSSHETLEQDEAKKIKLHEHDKKERRDSKDSTKSDKKSKHKNNCSNSHEKHSEERRREKEKEREERHKKHKLEKQKSKSKSRETDGKSESPVDILLPPSDSSSINDKDFLAKLNLRSNEEIERDKLRRERRSKDNMDPDKHKKCDSPLKSPQTDVEKHKHKKDRIRKITNSSDSDSDEPKKHSIFDIVDDGPPYISMYDKVKARSCKNMQKQEEEKRQEKIKAKFSQLKLSRARREEKKRSTSWDEDSDSDKDVDVKRKSRKLLDSSDESQERKGHHHKRKDMLYSDSDNSLHLRSKDSTDEDIKLKHPMFKTSKSRIASDSSGDEYEKQTINKLNSNTEYEKKSKSLFDNDTEPELEVKHEKITSVKSELERLVKKERRNSKFQEFGQTDFDVLHTEPSEVKTDFNNRSVFENTSDEEIKREKSEKREKKHKKKQKKQKHSVSSEESSKIETTDSMVDDLQEKKHHEKKKDHSKKDKKRDKTKEGRDKSKKSKKSKSEDKTEPKREGKMENIFGSLSEDSEPSGNNKPTFIVDENAQVPTVYNTDSDKDNKIQEEREHKRKKEKRRREKERRIQEAAAAAAEEPPNSNDNSMDLADMSKQLEANIKDDTSEVEVDNFDDDIKKEREERKELKEKKKKRKKSKDEKKHHHHHHHHKVSKNLEVKQEIPEPPPPLSLDIPEIKVEKEKSPPPPPPTTPGSSHSQSLPSLVDVQSPTNEKPEFIISPNTRDMVPLISPIPKTPTSAKVKREKILPAFGAEIDAIKSISEPSSVIINSKIEEATDVKKEETKDEASVDLQPQDKPRVVISQEETEDAVAALLHSIGGSTHQFEFTEEQNTSTEEAPPELVEEVIVQDDEEMRKAVQSLEVDGELSKPDTPQSEHELQIDTDTEEDASQSEQRPKTPEAQYFEKVPYKSLPSPPSLTPIKAEVKKIVEPVELEQRTVIAQTFKETKPEVALEQTKPVVVVPPSYPPLTKLLVPVEPPVVVQHSRHNLPVQVCKPPEVNNAVLNRLPITPVMVSKPLQPTTVYLPQPKLAHSTSEPPKLTTTVEMRPRMVYPPHYAFTPAQPPRIMRPNLRHPSGLLMPTRHPNYGQYISPTYVQLPPENEPPRTIAPVINIQSTNNPTQVAFVAPLSARQSPKSVIIEGTPSVDSNKQVSTIVQAPPKAVTPDLPQSPVKDLTPPEPVKEVVEEPPIVQKEQIAEIKEPIHLALPPLECRTSTPSPVIVPNPEVKAAIVEPPQSPLKLAIETVTDELNLSLEKKEEVKEEEVKEDESKIEEVKTEEVPVVVDKVEDEPIKEEDNKPIEVKATIEEDPLGSKDDNDFWSNNTVNIDSVIKTLNSADELSDNEHKDDKPPAIVATDKEELPKSPEKAEAPTEENKPTEENPEANEKSNEAEKDQKLEPEILIPKSSARRGRGGRPRGTTKAIKTTTDRGGIQTRRGKLKEAQSTPQPVINSTSKRGRGGKVRGERKSSKSESESTNDVYEFKEDSDDNKEHRPRLVLTIKSTTSSTSNAQPTAIIKEITKDGAKEIGKEVVKPKEVVVEIPPPVVVQQPSPVAETKEEFTSPQAANTRKSRRLAEKDISRTTVDDTIEDVIKNTPLTRANQRRSGRQPKKPPATVGVISDETPRKSPRGRKPSRRASEAAENSSSEDLKEEVKPVETPVVSPVKLAEPPIEKPIIIAAPVVEEKKEKKVDHCSLKTAMLKRFKGEMSANKQEHTSLIDPVTGVMTVVKELDEGKYIPLPGSSPVVVPEKINNEIKPSVIAQPHQVTVVQQSTPKVHSLKAHVLSSQAAKAVVSETPIVQKAPVVDTVPSVVTTAKPLVVTPNNVPTSVNLQSVGPMSPRPGAPPVGEVKPPVLSPTQHLLLNNQKQMLQAREQQLAHLASKQIVNTQLAHMKHQQVLMGTKTKPQHPLQHLSSPVLKAQRIIQTPTGKGVMEPPKIDVNLPNIMLARPNLSPSGPQARLAGLPVPAYEASLGEPIPHFAPGPHLNPAHYMHSQHMIYQQFIRQQQQHFQQRASLDKSGEEGEEAPVGLALSGRGAAVPHHSPHDRATESPAIGQVYNTLSARLPPYHTRYFDQQPAEPPPAHRPLTSHDRAGLPHIPPLGTPDRPLGAHGAVHSTTAHLIPDRPTGVIPERPLSAHLAHGTPERTQTSYAADRLLVGAGLGAAGNLMGAVAKHIGIDASNQRGIQAATPPLASQVPPQAESLFMLLKQYPLMWQGLLALKNDQAAVQMYFVSGNDDVANSSLPKNTDGSTPPLRIFQRMRLEPMQVEGVARKMQMEKEHCMLLALPCGHDHMDVLKQSNNLTLGFITYLQQKQAAGIVNVAAPGTTHPPAYVVHIFPSCDFVNENLRRIAPSLLERVADIAHLMIVITTV